MVGKVSPEMGGGEQGLTVGVTQSGACLGGKELCSPSYPLHRGLISLQDTPLLAESGPTLLDSSVWLLDPTLNSEDQSYQKELSGSKPMLWAQFGVPSALTTCPNSGHSFPIPESSLYPSAFPVWGPCLILGALLPCQEAHDSKSHPGE